MRRVTLDSEISCTPVRLFEVRAAALFACIAGEKRFSSLSLHRWMAVFTADVCCSTLKYMALFVFRDSTGALLEVHIYFMKEICPH